MSGDADVFSIDSSTGQLQTRVTLDHEKKSSYTFTITASDGYGGSASIKVTVDVTDVNDPPVFTDGSSTTRYVIGNMVGNKKAGNPVAALDEDGDTLTYNLSGADVSWFSINSNTGQIVLNNVQFYSWAVTYFVTVNVSDGNGGSASIAVKIIRNYAPVFTNASSTTRSIAENTASGTNIGTPFAATDADEDTLTYSLGGTDAASFSINSSTGQLQTNAALNHETKTTYSITITADDGKDGSVSINVTVIVTDVDEAPVFTDGSSTTRSIAEHTASGTNIGTAVAATDPDGDTLTYFLSGTDVTSFSIDTETGQLQTKAALDYEKKTSYSITITVYDGEVALAGEDEYNGNSASITVTVNVTNVNETPVFTDGSSATRSVVQNAAANTNIGSPITASVQGTDLTHTYEIIPTGHYIAQVGIIGSFSIDSNTGQLKTKVIILIDVGISLKFKVKASNSAGGSATIPVTVNVVAAGSAPTVQQTPANTALLANYPNPFNPETWVPYQLSKSANVSLTIYNMKGEMVRQLALGHKAAGNYLSRSRAIHWDGKNQSGEKVATGVYFYRFAAGNFSATRKMLIIK